MNLFLSIHNVLNIKLTNAPEVTINFIKEILGYFERENQEETCLEIEFVEKVNLPDQYIYLKHDCLYNDGCLYLMLDSAVLCFPIKNLFSPSIHILSESNVSHIEILYLIEKIICIRAIDRGYPTVHALCLEENGAINIYSGLQGAGKTTLALKKLRNGAKFLGEDKVFVDCNAGVYCYPRGITVHRYLGEEYERLRFNSPLSKRIKKEISFFVLLKLTKKLLFFNKTLSTMLGKAIKGPGSVRAYITKLMPETEIVDTGRIDGFYSFFKSNSGPVINQHSDWDINRIAGFLLKNNEIERSAQFLDVFYAYGDIYSFEVQNKMAELADKERSIILDVLNKLKRSE